MYLDACVYTKYHLVYGMSTCMQLHNVWETLSFFLAKTRSCRLVLFKHAVFCVKMSKSYNFFCLLSRPKLP